MASPNKLAIPTDGQAVGGLQPSDVGLAEQAGPSAITLVEPTQDIASTASQPTDGPDINDLEPIFGKDKGEEASEPTSSEVSAARQDDLQAEVARLEAEGKPRVLTAARSKQIGRVPVEGITGPQVNDINTAPPINPPLQMRPRNL